MIFVPTIVWTVLIWCTFTGPMSKLTFLPASIPDNAAFYLGLAVNLYYITLEPVAGVRSFCVWPFCDERVINT